MYWETGEGKFENDRCLRMNIVRNSFCWESVGEDKLWSAEPECVAVECIRYLCFADYLY